jgi:hypothetical protein
MTANPPVSYEALVDVSDNLFQLTDFGVVPEVGEPLDGLVVPLVSGGVSVLCGISGGPVRVRAEEWATAPPAEMAGWDDVAEVEFDAPAGKVRVTPLFLDPVPEIGFLTSGPGTYRVRVHARGRDLARNRYVDSPTEEYLIQVWPAGSRSPGGES